MPIHSLSLKNFKCFKEIDVDFSRITLLTGANSSGKSSLIYSILGMLQTKRFPFYYSLNGEFINMGGYKEVVFKGDVSKEIEIAATFTQSDLWKTGSKEKSAIFNYSSKLIFDKRNGLPDIKELNTNAPNYSINVEKDIKRYVLSISMDAGHAFLAEQLKNGNLYKKAKYKKIEGTNIFVEGAVFKTIEEVEQQTSESVMLLGLASFNVQDITFGYNYISSFRTPPERTYYRKTKSPYRISKTGEGYIDQIIEWAEQKSPKYILLKKILQDAGLAQDVKIRAIEGGRVELRMQIAPKGILSTLADIGFGVSHFLPIIVADLQLPDKSTLAVSQPENDLHPSVQAKFGDYLTKQVKSSEKQYIIETHSEYIINRLRLNIAKGELLTEDVAVYYLENGELGSIAHKITFTKDGQIHGAPKGFFETYMMDVMDIALNAEEE